MAQAYQIDTKTRNIIYNKIDLGVTIEQIQDLTMMNGIDVESMLEYEYSKQLSILRESKIDEILK